MSICCKKNVMLGFSVSTRLAEYPAHNPSRPFSRLSSATVSLNVPLSVAPLPRRLAVCCRVTTLLTGVVNALEHAPAAAPTASSSNTLRYLASSLARSRLARNHYTHAMSASKPKHTDRTTHGPYRIKQKEKKRIRRRLGQIRSQPRKQRRYSPFFGIDSVKRVENPVIRIALADCPVRAELSLDLESCVHQVEWVDCERRCNCTASARGRMAQRGEQLGCARHLVRSSGKGEECNGRRW